MEVVGEQTVWVMEEKMGEVAMCQRGAQYVGG